jgi:tyrosyl-tRNA synthetase
MPLEFFLDIASRQTVARVLERADFYERYKEGKDISLLEFIYPLLQAYDSVVLKADAELGGTDQKFNLLMGRTMQRRYNQPEQIVITTPLLEGTDGVQKMSKSLANYIGINEQPKEMFGKIMSISDELMWRYYELLTDVSTEDISRMKNDAKENRLNPKDAKVRLAKEIITTYHDKEEARKAAEEFENVFKKGETPKDISVFEINTTQPQWICGLLTSTGLTSSNSEARRLIEQGGVSIDGEKITDPNAKVQLGDGNIIKAGRRGFRKISIRKK